MPSRSHGTFVDRALEELDGERKVASLLLEATEREHGPTSTLTAAAFDDYWATYRLWFDTWEASWRWHQMQCQPRHHTRGWA